MIRIVKLSIRSEHEDDFVAQFEGSKSKIFSQAGCRMVYLLRDQSKSGVFFTLSIWDSVDDLDAYRASDLFGGIWPVVKTWFAEAPEAWSTDSLGGIPTDSLLSLAKNQ